MANRKESPQDTLRNWLIEQKLLGAEFVKRAQRLDRELKFSGPQLSRILLGRCEPTREQAVAIQALTSIDEREWGSAVVRRIRRKLSQAA